VILSIQSLMTRHPSPRSANGRSKANAFETRNIYSDMDEDEHSSPLCSIPMDPNPTHRIDATSSPLAPPHTGSRGLVAAPKYEQRPLVSEFGTAPSLTHAHTNMPPKDGGAGSLYSYQSGRDLSGLLKNLHGRWVRLLLKAHLNRNN
jgi:hypothetical protein